MGRETQAAFRPDESIQRDVDILGEFLFVYCFEKHSGEKSSLSKGTGGLVGRYLARNSSEYCGECRRLLLHAVSKRLLCPYHPKPSCKKCPTHCYGQGYREKIREVMRFAGRKLIMRGRFGLIKKYFS